MAYPRKSIETRFWEKVGPTRYGCLLWVGAVNDAGYGVFSEGGGSRRQLRAHRVSWRLHFGPVPSGFHVLHACDVRRCVSPAHLFLGTDQDNLCDMRNKGRAVPPPVLCGEDNGFSCLHTGEVEEIRALVAGGQSMRSVGHLFAISHTHVGRIVRREVWRHV